MVMFNCENISFSQGSEFMRYNTEILPFPQHLEPLWLFRVWGFVSAAESDFKRSHF